MNRLKVVGIESSTLVQRNELLENIFFKMSPDLFCIVSKEGYYVALNPAWEATLGYSIDEILHTRLDDLLHPEDLNRTQTQSKIQASGIETKNFINRYRCKDGSYRWLEWRATTNQSDFSRFAVARDITAQKDAEFEIQLKNEELNKINDEKDTFFSILAHDIRSPFNGFLGLTDVMVNELDQMSREEIREISVLLNKSANNLYDLLENLLDWSRLQRGLINVSSESFLVFPRILESLSAITEAARKKEIEFDFDVPADLQVYTDANILDSIFRNLFNNGVKFTPKGGRITVSAKSNSDNLVEILIKDTGIGMNRKMLDNLFRLDVDTGRKGTENESSSGMGLIICRDLIGKLGGELQVHSVEGAGSEFKFSLPLKKI